MTQKPKFYIYNRTKSVVRFAVGDVVLPAADECCGSLCVVPGSVACEIAKPMADFTSKAIGASGGGGGGGDDGDGESPVGKPSFEMPMADVIDVTTLLAGATDREKEAVRKQVLSGLIGFVLPQDMLSPLCRSIKMPSAK